MKNSYKTFIGEPETKTPLGRPAGRWEDIINIDPKEEGCRLD
jgi:hypothetical protein